jgi:hypothetical protein
MNRRQPSLKGKTLENFSNDTTGTLFRTKVSDDY